jgi:hypothetical protein
VIRDWITQIANDPSAEPDPVALVRAAQRVREGSAYEFEGVLPEETVAPKSDGSAPALSPAALPQFELDDAASPTIEAGVPLELGK